MRADKKKPQGFSSKGILEKALEITQTDRRTQYGRPERNFETIADLWSVYLGVPIKPKDVAIMQVLLKIARVKSGMAKEDNFIDMAGYSALAGEVQEND